MRSGLFAAARLEDNNVFAGVGQAEVAANQFVGVIRIDVVRIQQRQAMLQLGTLIMNLLGLYRQISNLLLIGGIGPQAMLALKGMISKVADGHDAARRHEGLPDKVEKGRFLFHVA